MRAPSIAFALASTLCGVIASPAQAAMGRTPGTFAVSPMGAATYSIPIQVPPGPQGVQPRLALVYNSQSGGGYLGSGWTLAGISSISRCGATYAQDGVAAAVALSYSDRFCLDGNRLRITGGAALSQYGQPGTTYQTELATFSNVTASGVTGNGPTSFTALGKDGLTYEYGNGGNSTVAFGGTISTWMLDKVTDRSGNTMTIAYKAQDTNLIGIAVPDTISWTPSSQGSSTYNYKMVFSYSPTSSALAAGYVAGNQAKLASILFGINIQSSGTTIKNYVFGYASVAPTFHLTLTSVKECSDAAANDCLAPTNITYQAGTAGVPTPTTPSASGTTTGGTINTADFDGDGKGDLIFATTSGSNLQWWVQLSTPTGFTAPINTGAVTTSITNVLLADFNGKGGTQILAPSGSTWTLYTLNGSAFTSASMALPVTANATYSAVDVNGDGLADLVHALNAFDYNLRVQLNTTSGGAVSFATTPVVTSVPGKNTTCMPPFSPCPTYGLVSLFGNNQWRYSSTKQFDFNGDGRQDLILYSWTQPSGGTRTYSVMTLLSQGTGPFTASMVVPATDDHNQIQPLTWNDDACTDLEVGIKVYISACNGTSVSSFTLSASAFLSLDWNGDGRSDLINQTSSGYGLGLSTGTGISEGGLFTFTIGGGSTVLDKDGDGLDDIACTCGTSAAVNYGLHGGAGLMPDAMTAVTDGYGNSSTPTYVPIPQGSYTKGNLASYPEQDVQPTLFVVKQVSSTDGAGGLYTQTYSYGSLRKNAQGRGLENFQSLRVSDSRTDSPVVSTSFATAFPYTGFVNGVDVYQHNGTTLVSHVIKTLDSVSLDNTTNNQRTFPYARVSNTQNNEVGGAKNGQLISTVEVTTTLDSYGNTTNSLTTITDNDVIAPSSPNAGQVWTYNVANTFTPDAGTNWCLGLPTLQTTTQSANGVAPIARSMSQTVDYPNCRPTQQVIEPGNALYAVTVTLSYDAFGNTSNVITTGAGMAARGESSTWSDATHLTGQFPRTTTNALGHSTAMEWDYTHGLQLSETDPNNLRTQWQYDAFSRPTLETSPDGTRTMTAYNLCSATPGVCPSPTDLRYWTQVISQDTAGNPLHESRTFFDGIDRPRFGLDQNLDGSFVYRLHRGYDSLGRSSVEYEPSATESGPYHAFTYDGAGRPIIDALYVNGVVDRQSTLAYAGRTVISTDAMSKQSTTITDVVGHAFRSIDQDGYAQTFVSDAFGAVTQVSDNLGSTLFSASYVYGAAAFVTTKTDMDAGSWQYTTDALGEVVSYKDAKNAQFGVSYDPLSRPLLRTEPGSTTTWVWGDSAASHNIGSLLSLSVAGYSDTYSYDTLGRPSNRHIVTAADGTYDYDVTYNNVSGLPQTLTYPASTGGYRLKLQYLYQFGMLKQIKDNATGNSFWTADTLDARGTPTQETLGNGVVTARQINPATGFLSSIQSGVGGGTGLQSESYLYDLVGNLTQRQNNKLTLTENFFYDKLHRLTQSTVGADTNLAVAYDGRGNITSRRYVGSYGYDAIKKHAVTSAGGTTFGYDANGNMSTSVSPAGTTTINWTSFNQPSQITAPGNNSSQFSYDGNHQRWKQVASYAGGAETTVYIGGLMEKVTTSGGADYKHYIGIGSATVLYVRRANGTNNTYYVTGDNLNSTDVVTCGSDVSGCAAGTALVQESFASFGARRANNWQCGPPQSEMNAIAGTTRHGYTTHEMLDNMKLVNMNGRIYNPIIARFLSPDPHTTNPGNTQSYNRYSYVLNNPHRYVDPTGFEGMPGSGPGFFFPAMPMFPPMPYYVLYVPGIFDPYQGPPQYATEARLSPNVSLGNLQHASGKMASRIPEGTPPSAARQKQSAQDSMAQGQIRDFTLGLLSRTFRSMMPKGLADDPLFKPAIDVVYPVPDSPAGSFGSDMSLAAVVAAAVVTEGRVGGSKGVTYLYQKVGAAGEHLKFGITNNLATRYTAAELAGGELRMLAQGARDKMLALERKLHETLPIGPEERQSFYSKIQEAAGLIPPPYP